MVERDEVREKTRLSEADCDAALDWIEEAGLIQNRAIGGVYSITARGKRAYEEQFRPRSPVAAALPSVIQTFHGPVGSVQTGNQNTAQVMQQVGTSISEVLAFVDAIRLQAQLLPAHVRDEAIEQVENLKEELSGPNKPSRVKAALLALWHGTKTFVEFAPKVIELGAKVGFKLPPG